MDPSHVTPVERQMSFKVFLDERKADAQQQLIQAKNSKQPGRFVTIRGYLHSDELARHFDVISY